jgi:hypothetical protein
LRRGSSRRRRNRSAAPWRSHFGGRWARQMSRGCGIEHGGRVYTDGSLI